MSKTKTVQVFRKKLQISVSVQMTVERNYYSRGARLRVGKCIVNIGYLNVYIVNGGLIGDLINSNFRVRHYYFVLTEGI